MRALTIFLLISRLLAGQNAPDRAAILRQGEELIAAKQLTAAEDLYEKALHDFPGDPQLRYELGLVFFREQKWTKAIESFRQSAAEQPGKIKPLFYLAQSYFMASDLDNARRTMAQAANIAPNDPQVCQKYGEYLSATLENRKDGLAWLEKARNLNSNLPRIDFQIGKAEFDMTDYQSATANFELELQKSASDGEAAFYLAESRANLGEWSKARDSYSYALSHQYMRGPAFYGLGRAYVELADYAAAIDPLKQAVAMQPSLINAHFQLAKAYRQLKRNEEAQRESSLFAAMTDRVDTRGLNDPEEEEAWKQVKPLLEANNEQEALALLAKLPVAEKHDQAGRFYLLGVMYYSMGRNGDAKRALTLAQTKAPGSARVAAYLGMVQLSSGEVAAAENTFQSALKIDSGEPLALIGLGGLRHEQRRWADSITYLEKSRTADPSVLLMLCDAYYHDEKLEQAALISEVIRALGSDRKPVLDELDRLEALHRRDQSRVTPYE